MCMKELYMVVSIVTIRQFGKSTFNDIWNLFMHELYIVVILVTIKYTCEQCNCKTTQKCNLIQHVKYVHEGVKFSCNQCDCKYKWKPSSTKSCTICTQKSYIKL